MMITILPLAAEGVTMAAKAPFDSLSWFTNSVLVTVVVTVLIVFLARRATAKMEIVPKAGQNTFEALIEGLYGFFEGIVGKHMIAKTFPFLATVVIFLLATNIFGLLPGVGTIGWGERVGPLSIEGVHRPLLRPSGADLNMTAAMALIFMVLWFWWTMRETGPWKFLIHIFGPKGGMKGAILFLIVPLFLIIGVLEVISIAIRPVTLSLRHFGNISAGEVLLHIMGSFGEKMPFLIKEAMAVIIQLPFYAYELLVALIQAFVFSLLCAVYIQLSTSHEEDEHGGH